MLQVLFIVGAATLSIGILLLVQVRALRAGRYVHEYPIGIYVSMGVFALAALTVESRPSVGHVLWAVAAIVAARIMVLGDRACARRYETAMAAGESPKGPANIPQSYRETIVILGVVLVILLGLAAYLGIALWTLAVR